MSYVEFRDVKKVYKTGEVEINALRDVDFEIEKGEFCVIFSDTFKKVVASLPLDHIGNITIIQLEDHILYGSLISISAKSHMDAVCLTVRTCQPVKRSPVL